MREEKKNDKIIAIYHAIEELVAEGADLSSMRVSDIAARAGIGKGTTYEYFSSKEEMVVKSMVYLMDSMIKRILHQMENLDTFKAKFLMLLDEMEEKTKQRTCIIKYLSMISDMHLCEQMHEQLIKDTQNANPIKIIRYLIECGKEEGVIGTVFSQMYIETTIFSKVLAFVMIIDEEIYKHNCINSDLKEELYEGLCRELA